jgi:glyoxylase-like metal-dependent hydrolase (beta-lactamase superfamily II)
VDPVATQPKAGDVSDHTAEMPVYTVYAIKYAEREAFRGEHFLGGDPHETTPMNMDYFVWAVVGGGQTWVIDTGFGADDAARRKRRLLRTAAEGLALVGVDATTVADVVITHLHYDHVGGFDQFPAARFHVQDREVAFATGRNMTTPSQKHAFTPSHIAEFVLAVFGDRVVFHDGDDELAPGLSVHHVGGHTDGLQVVRVATRRGWLVLASDATHYYENIESNRPFSIVYDVDDMLAGFDRIRGLAGGPDLFVPGHDPQVFERYPVAAEGLEGIAVRLD